MTENNSLQKTSLDKFTKSIKSQFAVFCCMKSQPLTYAFSCDKDPDGPFQKNKSHLCCQKKGSTPDS